MDSVKWKRRSKLIPELWKSWVQNKINQNKTSFWEQAQPRTTQEGLKVRKGIPFLWRCTEQSFGPRRAQSAHQCAQGFNEETRRQSMNSVLGACINEWHQHLCWKLPRDTGRYQHDRQLRQLEDPGDPRTGDSREQGQKTFLSCMSCRTKRTVHMRKPTSSRDSQQISGWENWRRLKIWLLVGAGIWGGWQQGDCQ